LYNINKCVCRFVMLQLQYSTVVDRQKVYRPPNHRSLPKISDTVMMMGDDKMMKALLLLRLRLRLAAAIFFFVFFFFFAMNAVIAVRVRPPPHRYYYYSSSSLLWKKKKFKECGCCGIQRRLYNIIICRGGGGGGGGYTSLFEEPGDDGDDGGDDGGDRWERTDVDAQNIINNNISTIATESTESTTTTTFMAGETANITSFSSSSTGVATAAAEEEHFSLHHRLLDWSRLLSPKTWWGVLEIQNINASSPFSLDVLREGIWGIVLPLLILWNCQGMFCNNNNNIRRSLQVTSPPLTPPWLLLSLMSPWSWVCYYRIIIQQFCGGLLPALRFYVTGRAVALPGAVATLQERIRTNRAYRTRRYDVYLPPQPPSAAASSSSSSSNNNSDNHNNNNNPQQQRAILFFPGALVPHTAYAEVASRLSDDGLVVVVVSAEPLRLAHYMLGADRASMGKVMKHVQKKLRLLLLSGCDDDDDDDDGNHVEWTLMGHSMGSFAAMRLFDEFQKNDKKKRRENKPFVISNRLVLWGVAPFVPFATDLTKHEQHAKLLIVQGSNDYLRDLLQADNDALEALFPFQTNMEMIAGGTHDGFGSYVFPKSMIGVGNSGREEEVEQQRQRQQEAACRLTTAFLTKYDSRDNNTRDVY
jgi:hypothetical protein